jgi:hypothetical protein
MGRESSMKKHMEGLGFREYGGGLPFDREPQARRTTTKRRGKSDEKNKDKDGT